MAEGRFEYKLLSKYPHLNKYDAAIWNRFIVDYPDKFLRVDYDVVVGKTRKDATELKEEWQRNRDYLGKYKIDVVGYTENSIYIIEIKPKAAAKALGQIIMYDYLYQRDYKPQKQTIATIITDELMPDMDELCNEHNIKLYIV